MELTEKIAKERSKEFDIQCIQFLNLNKCNLLDVGLLSKCTQLVELSIANNSIKNISSLKGLNHLRVFDGSNNNIQNISPLTSCISLQRVWLHGNDINDIGCLNQKLLKLRHLTLTSKIESNPICSKYSADELMKKLSSMLPNLLVLDGNTVPFAKSYMEASLDNVSVEKDPLVIPRPLPWITQDDIDSVEEENPVQSQLPTQGIMDTISACEDLVSKASEIIESLKD